MREESFLPASPLVPALLVSIPEAARLLSVSPSHVRAMVANIGGRGGQRKRKPRLPSVLIGSSRRIAVADLQAFIAANKSKAA